MARFSQNASRLQTIDRIIGVPLCLTLTIAHKIAQVFNDTPGATPPRKILFLKLAEQGSTVLAYGAITKAIAAVGREQVYFLLFEENRFIVDALGIIRPENVFVINTSSPWQMLRSASARLREIRRRGIDACIDMEFFTRFPAIIAFFTGARIRVGFHGAVGEAPYRGDLHTHRLPYNPHLHTSATFLLLVMALEQDPAVFPTFAVVPPPPLDSPRFCYSGDEREAVSELIAKAGIKAGQPIILLNANASDLLPLRRWEGKNYVELARRLLKRFTQVQIGFTGGPDEAPRIDQYVREVNSPRCVSLAGRTTLRQLLIVYELAEVLVTNDSGPAHFATLTGIDCVALFGPETPKLYAGLGPRQHPMWAQLACSPCVNAFNNRQTACRDNRCMQALSVDDVGTKVAEVFLARTARKNEPSAVN